MQLNLETASLNLIWCISCVPSTSLINIKFLLNDHGASLITRSLSQLFTNFPSMIWAPKYRNFIWQTSRLAFLIVCLKASLLYGLLDISRTTKLMPFLNTTSSSFCMSNWISSSFCSMRDNFWYSSSKLIALVVRLLVSCESKGVLFTSHVHW